MKTKSTIRNLVIAGMGAAMISAAVGSIGGTVAWFQYNTRATAAYTGAAAKCTENLQIRIYDADLYGTNKKYADLAAYKAVYKWGSEITTTQIQNYILAKRGKWVEAHDEVPAQWKDGENSSLYPVTSGSLAANTAAATLYSNPDKATARENYSTWDAAGLDRYVEVPLQFRLLDVDGNTSDRNYKDVPLYISNLDLSANTVANTANGKKNITDALRVSFADSVGGKTFSNHGNDVVVHGNMDLDFDGALDYIYVDENGDEVLYDYKADETNPTQLIDYGGEGEPVAKSTKIDTNSMANISGENKYAPVGGQIGTLVGGLESTIAENGWYTLTMRIYLEGWQKLDGYDSVDDAKDSTLWSDRDYVGSQVNVGMTFNVAAIK